MPAPPPFLYFWTVVAKGGAAMKWSTSTGSLVALGLFRRSAVAVLMDPDPVGHGGHGYWHRCGVGAPGGTTAKVA